jgi:hypothetical protein
MRLGLGLRGVLVLVLVLAASGCFNKPPAPGTAGDSGVGDGAGDGVGDGQADASVSPNYMFVTSGSWTGIELSNLATADSHCAEAATAGGVQGTFVAWVSTATVDANARLGGARGWIRRDGEPFADQVNDIINGRLFYPPNVNEFGVEQSGSLDVYTGTGANGLRANACPGATSGTIGALDATTDQWTELNATSACGNSFHVYCFGVDNNFAVIPPPAPAGALRAFVTTGSSVQIGDSVSTFDQACMVEATTAGLSGTFVALVATVGGGARARLLTNPEGWYRVDDVKIANDETFTLLRAPLNVTADKMYGSGKVWTGVPSANTTFDTPAVTASSCDDWGARTYATDAATGDIQRSNKLALSHELTPCSASIRVYCFQDPN